MDELHTFRAVLIAVTAAAATSSAWAAEPAAIGQTPVERMIDLNRKAFTDIQNQRFHAAKYWLNEALVISETAALENDEMTARTYVHLAALHLNGRGDRQEALRYFTLALKINPNITITPGLETPALKAAYLEARENMGLPPKPDSTATVTVLAGKSSPVPPPSVPRPPPTASLSGKEDLDPDLPARVRGPLYCSVPFEIPAQRDLLVRCLTQKQQKRASATLYFRTDATATKYTALPMARSPKGCLIGVIPGRQIHGRSLAYFVKGKLPGTATPLYNGYPEAPNALLVTTPAPASGPAASPGTPTDTAEGITNTLIRVS